MSSQQPSLQQRDHTVDARKQMLSFFLTALYLAVMNVSIQAKIASPAIGSDCAPRRNRLLNEPVQAQTGRVWNHAKANTSDALSIFFGGDDNQSLFLRPSADYAGFFSTPIGLVHLDNAVQPIAAGANHGPAQLMQHRQAVL
jgi:hypothetical protein